MPRQQDGFDERDDGRREPGGTSALFLLAYFGGIAVVAGLIVAVVYFTGKPAGAPDLASDTKRPGESTPEDANPFPTGPRTQPTRTTPSTGRRPTGPSGQPGGFIPFPEWKEFSADGVTCMVPGDVTMTASADQAKSLAAIRPGAKAYESNNSFNGYFYLYIFPLEAAEAARLTTGGTAALDELLVKVLKELYAVSLKSGSATLDDKVKPTDAPFLGKTGRAFLGVRMTFTPVKARAGVAGDKLVVALAFNAHEGPNPYPASTRYLDSFRVR